MVSICIKCTNTCKKPDIKDCEQFLCSMGQNCLPCSIVHICRFATHLAVECKVCGYAGIIHKMTLYRNDFRCPVCDNYLEKLYRDGIK